MRQKSRFSIFLVIIMLINMLPVEQLNAFDANQYTVESITIFKIYDSNRNPEVSRLLITGTYLKDAEVGMITSTGYYPLARRTVNTEGILQFDINDNQLGNSILIEGYPITVDEEKMPTLTGISRKVKESEGTINMKGTNLRNLGVPSNNIVASYERQGQRTPIPGSYFIDAGDEVSISNPTGALGLQNIIFEKKDIKSYNFPGKEAQEVTVTITYTYKDQFHLYKNIEINDADLTMYPNRGQKGDRVYFETPGGKLDSYDVFFIKHTDGTDPYTNLNKGQNKSFQQNVNGKDILTVEVPNIEVGEYFVVFTNAVTAGKDPMTEVTQEKILVEKFTVISSTLKSRIISINPKSGPDTGSKATLSAQFAGTLNIQEFVPQTDNKVYSFADGDKTLIINYGEGSYKGSSENNYFAERKIKVIIGDSVTFMKESEDQPDSIFTKDLDTINLMTPQITDADVQPVKDVVMEIETTITDSHDNIIQSITERAVLKNGYTYIVSKVSPIIETVTPERIQVVEKGDIFAIPGSSYMDDKGRLIAINGKNFMIHKYTDPVTGADKIRYPVVDFGPDIILNKNTNPDIDIKVLNAAGAELDGSAGNELGTKILIYIPPDMPINNIGKTYLKVTNPIRNSMSMGLHDERQDFIEFVLVDENKNPVIGSVKPDMIAVEGGVEIKISGSNFLDGIKLYIDGAEIKNIKRSEDGKEITFIAPKGREGSTQLMVMNPEGGTATWPFIYVKTYTNPKISYFAPKSGNTGTLVIVKGDNFLAPDPAAVPGSPIMPDMVYRLIGTRILLGEEDINEYLLDPVTKKIVFEGFVADSAAPLLSIKSEGSLKYIKAADYYNSIVLETETVPGRFYTLNIDGARRITLSDGINNSYILEIEGNQIKANKIGGSIYNLYADNEGITIKDNDTDILKLIMKTPYKTAPDGDGHKIIGNLVKVVDKNTIYFTVPTLPADGYYDVTVLNPDTKRDDKRGTDGFLYFKLPQSKPEIDTVEPNEGTTDGGYAIDIIGKEFDDIGVDKVKVYINGIQANPDDVTVSPDGKKITVHKVPKYPGDLYKEKGTNRYTVPVVIVNPDGGSASKADGFTYLVPTSHPNILKVVPVKGTAAGGEIVEIAGSDFRFFEPYEDNNRNQIRDEDEWFNDINGNGLWDSDASFEYEEELEDGTIVVKDWREPTPLNHPRYNTYYASPLLPKVFFGDSQGKIVEFGRGYLKVISPEGKPGKVDLYIVNNDSGISNKFAFTYESSNPKITRIFPKSGKMQGGDIIELQGSNFAKTSMDIYNGEVAGGQSVFDTVQMAAVRFGSVTNRRIDRTEENSGRIDNKKATIRFPALSLTVEYDANVSPTVLKLSKVIGDTIYSAEIKGYDDSVKYIPLSILKNSQGAAYETTGLIRVEVEDRRLLIDTGYSEDVRYESGYQIFIKVPAYHTIGKNIPVELINPDKGTASTVFEYMNPYDFPVITGIEPINKVLRENLVVDYDDIPTEEDLEYYTYVSLAGGVLLTIRGQNFKRTAKVYFDDKEVQIIDRSANGDRLIVAIPQGNEGMEGVKLPIFVDNGDGGVATTREINEYNAMKAPYFIVYQKGMSYPYIERVIPDKTSARGENIVTIIGSDIRAGAKVYIGGIEAHVEEITPTERIKVKVPLGLIPGKATIMILNPDYGSYEKKDAITIISSPLIEDVLDENGLSIDTKLLSMLGGENIKIKGTGFLDGAQIIFGGQIKESLEDGETGLYGINIRDREVYIVGGTVVTGRLEEGIYLNLTTPQMKEGQISIIVLNKDGGVSEEYIEFEATRPIPDSPTSAKAIAVDGNAVKLIWKGTGNMYQIYASYGDKENSKDLSVYNYMLTVEPEKAEDGSLYYFVTGLMTETWYRFRIIAVNEFGISKNHAETNKVKTPDTISSEYKYNDEYQSPGNRTDYGETTKDSYIYNVGEKSVKEVGSYHNIELRNKNIKDGLKRQIKIPVAVIQSYDKTYNLWDKDVALKINNKGINTAEISELKGINRNDAVGIIEIYNPTNQRYDDIIMAAGRRKTIVKTVGIGYKLQKQDKATVIKKLMEPVEAIFIMDEKYAKVQDLELYYYNSLKRALESIPYIKIPGERTLKANIINPGEYIIIGK